MMERRYDLSLITCLYHLSSFTRFMKALRVEETGVAVRDVPDPVPAGEAVVRIILSGICNTDLEIARGYAGFKTNFTAAADLKLVFGLDVSNPCGWKPFFYDSDYNGPGTGTNINLRASARATNLNFTAGLGAINISVVNGTAKVSLRVRTCRAVSGQ